LRSKAATAFSAS